MPLAKMIHSGSLDEKYVAVTGLEQIGTHEAGTQLERALKGAIEEEIRQLILDVLAKWSMSQ